MESQWGLANFTVAAECACICVFGPGHSVIGMCLVYLENMCSFKYNLCILSICTITIHIYIHAGVILVGNLMRLDY